MDVTIFQNTDHNERFRSDGYLILDALSGDALEQLIALYKDHLAGAGKEGLYESTGANEKQVNDRVAENIRSILRDFASSTFGEHDFYGGGFLVKSPVNSTELHLHQDWSFVDESRHNALFIWIPLQPVSMKNGTIYLVKGSHRLYDNYRSASYYSRLIDRHEIPEDHITTIDIEPGQLLIYSPAIYHGSYANKTRTERVAATSMVTSPGAELRYVHKEGRVKAGIYRVRPDSYLNDINYLAEGKVPPGAELIAKQWYVHRVIRPIDLKRKLEGKDRNFLQVIPDLFR